MTSSTSGGRTAFATDASPVHGRDLIFVKDWVIDC